MTRLLSTMHSLALFGRRFRVLVYLHIFLINNTVENIDKIFSHEELYVCIVLQPTSPSNRCASWF